MTIWSVFQNPVTFKDFLEFLIDPYYEPLVWFMIIIIIIPAKGEVLCNYIKFQVE